MLRTRFVHRDELDDETLHDALVAIHDQDGLDLLIVKQAVPAARCRALVADFASDPHQWPWTPQEDRDIRKPQMIVVGRTATPVVGDDHFDLPAYLACAEGFRAGLERLAGPDGRTLEDEISDVMHRLSGGRDVRCPRAPDGREYAGATVRMLPPGHGIPVHCGNYFLGTPGYEELAPQILLEDQLSFFMPLATPRAGGTLRVYDLSWGDPQTPTTEDEPYDGPAIAEGFPYQEFAPEVGDLLLFDGGRWYHDVSTIEGPIPRWTMGGFLGLTPDRSAWMRWS